MKRILTLSLLLIVIYAVGQTPIEVTETTIKVGAFGEEVFYYGFAEGDQMLFNFQEVNGKELKEVEVIELPTSSKYMDYKTKLVKNKTINVTRTCIYKFRFSNSAMGGRVCKIKIQRIPANDVTKNFNPSVYWKTVQDTSYTPVEKEFLLKSDTLIQEFYSSNPQVSSTNAFNGNKPYQLIDFDLPINTVAWSFYIGTGREGKEAYDKAREAFTKNAAASVTTIPGYGPMAALALTGVSYFNKMQGEDNVKYAFLSGVNNAQAYINGQPYQYFKGGDVISEATQMKSPLRGKVYLGIANDNFADPIVVTIKATAVIVNQQWEKRMIQEMKVVNKQEAYLKN